MIERVPHVPQTVVTPRAKASKGKLVKCEMCGKKSREGSAHTCHPFELWSTIIERWNALKKDERAAIRAECAAKGHDRRETPIGNVMCYRCCEYVRK